jgi:high-affinity iron transporter
MRLPMTTLFRASTVVLVVTAVVLLGQGIHSFEEVGILPSHPMPFLRIEFLGIYPDRLGALAQMALAALPLAWWGYGTRSGKGAALKATPDPGE